MNTHTLYLTDEQVFALNEKHGWFTDGDAQSDVSKAFAQDAVVLHERIRAAAPDLLKACKLFIEYDKNDATDGVAMMFAYSDMLKACRAAIAKAEGGAA